MGQTVHEQESYNLINEPWIPVLLKNGQSEEVGILQAFQKAEEIIKIAGDLPTQSFSILRLLLAILQSACSLENEEPVSLSFIDWQNIKNDWSTTCAEIETYLTVYRDRFDLCDNERPFFQVADLHTGKNEIPGLESLIMDVPNGAPFFTMRSGKGLHSLSYAEAARWLINAQACDIAGIHAGAVGDPRVKGGKGYSIGTGWLGCLGGVYLEGNNLHETLCWNFVLPNQVGWSFDIKNDRPVWEQEKPHDSSPRTIGDDPFGQIDLFTWQSRRIRLYRERGVVVGALVAQGDPVKPQNMFPKEAFTGWRYSDPQSKKAKTIVYMPRKHQATQQMWRGLHSLLPGKATSPKANEPAKYKKPALFEWAAFLNIENELPDNYRCKIHAVGIEYGTQESSVAEIIGDELSLPASVLCSNDWSHIALMALDSADKGASAVATLTSRLRQAESASADVDAVRNEAREQAYAKLDGAYRKWLSTINVTENTETNLEDWEKLGNKILLELGNEIMAHASPASIIGRKTEQGFIDAALADDRFRGAIRAAFPRAYMTKENVDQEGERDG